MKFGLIIYCNIEMLAFQRGIIFLVWSYNEKVISLGVK